MGYSTDFEGELKFTCELTTTQLAHLNSMLGENPNDHPEWNASDCIGYIGYIDLKLLKDFSGIKWSGVEKTRGMVEAVNLIIAEMRKRCPKFGLEGKLKAQGEDTEDRWELIFENGIAVQRRIELKGKKVKCPRCREVFFCEEK